MSRVAEDAELHTCKLDVKDGRLGISYKTLDADAVRRATEDLVDFCGALGGSLLTAIPKLVSSASGITAASSAMWVCLQLFLTLS